MVLGILLAAIIAVVIKKKKGIDVTQVLSESLSNLFSGVNPLGIKKSK
jgi:hypothetical protein